MSTITFKQSVTLSKIVKKNIKGMYKIYSKIYKQLLLLNIFSLNPQEIVDVLLSSHHSRKIRKSIRLLNLVEKSYQTPLKTFLQHLKIDTNVLKNTF